MLVIQIMMFTSLSILFMVLRTLLLEMSIFISRGHLPLPLRKKGFLKIIYQGVLVLELARRVRVYGHLEKVHHPLRSRSQGRDWTSQHPPLVEWVIEIGSSITIGPRVDKVPLLLCLKGRIRIADSSSRRVGHLHIVRRVLVREVPLTLVFRRVGEEMIPRSMVLFFCVVSWDTSLWNVLKRHLLGLVGVQLCQSLQLGMQVILTEFL